MTLAACLVVLERCQFCDLRYFAWRVQFPREHLIPTSIEKGDTVVQYTNGMRVGRGFGRGL